MLWFKHFSDSLDDPFIQELMDNFGHQGYVAWFGILEIIAKENGSKLTGKIEISPIYLKRKLRISTAKLKQIFEFCSGKVGEKLEKSSRKPKLISMFSKEKWIISVPKLLELKDNYSKDLQETRKKPSHHKEVEVDKEVDKEKELKALSDLEIPKSDAPPPQLAENKKINSQFRKQSAEILEFLNSKTNHAFRHVDTNLDPIIARLKSGISPGKIRQVIAMKAREWLNDDKMAGYLRPKTLFSRGNLENYLGQLIQPEQKPDGAISPQDASELARKLSNAMPGMS